MQGWKAFSGTNTLAYLAHLKFMKKKFYKSDTRTELSLDDEEGDLDFFSKIGSSGKWIKCRGSIAGAPKASYLC
jgi:hypothetical protein